MKFLAVLAFASAAMAVPTTTNTTPACPDGFYNVAQCCATLLLGVIGLDCTVPPRTPNSPRELRDTCSDVGKQGACCTIPVAGQALLCTSVPAN